MGWRVVQFFLFCWISSFLFASEGLISELQQVQIIDKKINHKLPLLINYQMQGGYLAMPSARTYDAGVFSLGFFNVPPYRLWNLGFQFFNHIETTGNYWVFDGLESFPGMGFGDDAERSANVKFILLRKEDGFPFVPDIAIGWNDFFGTKRFSSFYTVATQEFLSLGLEASVGWGCGRIDGFFAGIGWTPWQSASCFLRSCTLALEYDANDYRKHPMEHPGGRSIKSRVNGGIQANFWDLFHLSFSSVRGEKLAASASFHYHLGESEGLFPKVFDKPAYKAPVDLEPVGLQRSRQELASEFAFAFKNQGFELSQMFLLPGARDSLWIKVINLRYREEMEVRSRIESLLASLMPSNLTTVTVVLEADGVLEHQYTFRVTDLYRYRNHQLGAPEFAVLSPMKEVTTAPSRYDAALLYHRKKPLALVTCRPWMRTFLGSAQGKFKYETGLSMGVEGYILGDCYYSSVGSYTAFASTQNLAAQDTLNPSRIINVRTDTLKYNQSSSFQLTEAYLQKSFNIGAGWFSRAALGYFEPAYGGLALEALYYPVGSSFGVGFEGASLLKRSYSGIGFTTLVRLLTDSGPIYETFYPIQYFANFYYQYRPLSCDFKASFGQFLAKDKGVRIEGARNFPSGLRVGLWWTFTNAHDMVNNHLYFDKGISISMPLDLFLNQSSRSRVGYSMSAWLRDCGAQAATGKTLYSTLSSERQVNF